MRLINTILKFFVMFIFNAVFWVTVLVLVFILAIGASPEGADSATIFTNLLNIVSVAVGIMELVFFLIGVFLAFSLICPLLEIAENTRVLRDAVESGDLKLTQSDKD